MNTYLEKVAITGLYCFCQFLRIPLCPRKPSMQESSFRGSGPDSEVGREIF